MTAIDLLDSANQKYDNTTSGLTATNAQGAIDELADRITSTVPSSATDTGIAGTIAWDANYIYVCVATNTWKRVAIATW